MMETKLFELRDEGTFISALVVRLTGESQRENWQLRRGGFSQGQIDEGKDFAMVHLSAGIGGVDPFRMGGGTRTWPTFYRYIRENWDLHNSGDVIDASFILGETFEVKRSEQELSSL